MPSQMCGSGREALSNIREWSGDPPGYMGVVGGPSCISRVVGRPSRLSEWSKGSPGCPVEFGKLSRMPGSGWKALPDAHEALPDVQEWWGGPPKCPRVVERPFQMPGKGQEAHPDVQEW